MQKQKPWSMMTEKEITKIKETKCKKCGYSMGYGGPGNILCDYLGITGHMRGCSPSECDKYKDFKKGTRQKVKPTVTPSKKKIGYRNTQRAAKSKTQFGKWFSLELDKRKKPDLEIARMLGVSKGKISSIARGETKPLEEDCRRIAEAFGADVNVLLRMRSEDVAAAKEKAAKARKMRKAAENEKRD